MTDREALLRAVAATPDDDTPRLIYADCLDEVGGEADSARARFIRLQIELARETNRGWFSRSDRLSEVCKLAGFHADKWLNELPKWAADETRRQRLRAEDFPRGFVETLYLRSAMLRTFIDHGSNLLDVAPIRTIEAQVPAETLDLKNLVSCLLLRRIRCLILHGYRTGDVVAAHVASSRALMAIEQLELSELSDLGANALVHAVGLGSLRVLKVDRGLLSNNAVADLLNTPALPRLQELRLVSCPDIHRWLSVLRQQFPSKRILH
jgi:uncharacterized protein (TIGR02996 family)